MSVDFVRAYSHLGFVPGNEVGNQVVGDCIFCGKVNKFYINKENGQFDCKSASCAKKGNVYTFLKLWAEATQAETPKQLKSMLSQLSSDRGIPVPVLKEHVFWSDQHNQWVMPIKNANGTIVNLKFYDPAATAKKLFAMPGLESSVFIAKKSKKKLTYICEGEWDAIALSILFQKINCNIWGVPGATIFKKDWGGQLFAHDVVLLYDNDEGGRNGHRIVADRLTDVDLKSLSAIRWPDDVADGYDVRDFVINESEPELLLSYVQPYEEEDFSEGEQLDANPIKNFPLLKDGGRPKLEDVLSIYSHKLFMTQDMIDALRVIYAVVISNQVVGDPLWIHIVAPPGGGKTELLSSCSTSPQCVFKSAVGPRVLVSGYRLPGGRDPSLIPRLFDKTFILKDFTEILKMNTGEKEEMFSVLRGAYDGRVERQFGNAVDRVFIGRFSMVSGVTPIVFLESNSTLGERFLYFEMASGELERENAILSALTNSGEEDTMRTLLSDAAKSFLDYRIEKDDIPEIPFEMAKRIASLANLVSMLRATVSKKSGDRLAYRPDYEVGTRVAKQLKKLLTCLSLQHSPPKVNAEDYRILVRTAISSCTGWNLDAVNTLINMEKKTIKEISDVSNVPVSTLRDQLDELSLLGIIHKTSVQEPGKSGMPTIYYSVSKLLKKHWEISKLSDYLPGGTPGPLKKKKMGRPKK